MLPLGVDYIIAMFAKTNLGTSVSSLYGAPRQSGVPTVLPISGFHRYPEIIHPKVSFGSCKILQGVALPLSYVGMLILNILNYPIFFKVAFITIVFSYLFC